MPEDAANTRELPVRRKHPVWDSSERMLKLGILLILDLTWAWCNFSGDIYWLFFYYLTSIRC